MKQILKSILDRKICKKQFTERRDKYKILSKYLPSSYNNILSNKDPWFCNGLAFRAATFSSFNESFFYKLNSLLRIAEKLEGWENKSKNTNSAWANNYDKLYHHLWMLQCIEYFLDKGHKVSFPGKATEGSPDLKVITSSNDMFYVECYVYSKWWFFESFIEHISQLIDPNIAIERVFNVKKLNMHKNLNKILKNIGSILSPEKIKCAQLKSSKISPYVLYEQNGIRIVMNGKGKYSPTKNAHGDPKLSIDTYIQEIINHKKNKNNLNSYHPNILFVNCLGYDFQNIFSNCNARPLSLGKSNIDKIQIYSCGIMEQLALCKKTTRACATQVPEIT